MHLEKCQIGNSKLCATNVQAALHRHLPQGPVAPPALLLQDMAFEDLDIVKPPATEEPGITAFNVSQESFQVNTGPDLGSTLVAFA